jgi:hypothetical protein
MAQTATNQRIHLLPDIWNGAIKGDYTKRLGLAGAVTQALIFYIPGVGTICAVRDYFACRRKHDTLGAILNLLAVFPVLGGFPKTAEVIHNFVTVHHALNATSLRHGYSGEAAPERRIANPLAGLSLLVAAATPLLLVLPANFVMAGIVAPPLAVLTAHLALGRARRHPDARAHRGTARVALALGYFYLLTMAITVGVLLWSGHSIGPLALPAHG